MLNSRGLPDEAWVAPRLHRVAAGGAAAFKALEELYLAYQGPIVNRLLGARLTRQDADDVLHKVFVKVAEKARQWRGEGPAGGWLWAIVAHALADAKREALRNSPPDGPSDGAGSLDNVAAPPPSVAEALQRCVLGALQRFEREHPDRADAIRLAYFQGWSTAELAPYLGRTLGATREFLCQCRKFAKPFFEPCETYLSGGD